MLIDPWFVGELTFGGADWMYAGRKRVIGRDTRVDMQQVLAEADVVVITQVRGGEGWRGETCGVWQGGGRDWRRWRWRRSVGCRQMQGGGEDCTG